MPIFHGHNTYTTLLNPYYWVTSRKIFTKKQHQMKDNSLRIGIITIWSLVIIQVVLALCFIFLKTSGLPFLHALVGLSFIIALILANDIFLNGVRYKWLWVYFLFAAQIITSLVYLIRRHKLIVSNK